MTFIDSYTFVDQLVFQHQRIRQLFESVLAGQVEDRDEAFAELRRLLAVHEAAEEIVVHPRARTDLRVGGALVDECLEEERTVKRLLAELEDMDIQSAEFVATVRILRDVVERHSEREERDEFIALRTDIDGDEAARMAETISVIESIAPTRPHPGAQSATANLLIGPFASMLDRARDAIAARIRKGAH